MAEIFHIACSSDDKFVPHCATMLASLFQTNRDSWFHIHIFEGGLNVENKLQLERFVLENHQLCTFYKVQDELLEKVPTDMRITKAAYYRIYIPEFLSKEISRVLYLDCDVIIRDKISSLWESDLNNFLIGAVEEHWQRTDELKRHIESLRIPSGRGYFNSGLLFINLSKWREEDITGAALIFISRDSTKIKFWDQDVLNAVIGNRWLKLDNYWNVNTNFFFDKMLPGYYNISKSELTKLRRNPGMVHFTGVSKPWFFWNRHPFKREYLYFRSLTPWNGKIRHTADEIFRETSQSIKEHVIRFFKFWIQLLS